MLGQKKYRIYRQGDILLVGIKNIPTDAQKKNNIIAYGEKTGHIHDFKDLENVQVFQKDGRQYTHVDIDETLLTHNEHEAVRVPQGDYMVIRQNEYDYFAEREKKERRMRQVSD
jgi:hypothetical protein